MLRSTGSTKYLSQNITLHKITNFWSLFKEFKFSLNSSMFSFFAISHITRNSSLISNYLFIEFIESAESEVI